MAELGFSLNSEEAAADFFVKGEVLAPGWYRVVITKSELVSASTGRGKVLKMEYETREGKKLKDSMNVLHEVEGTQRGGQAQLGKIATSIGHKGGVKNTDILHGRPFEVRVEVKEIDSKNTPGEKVSVNDVKDYRPAGTEAPATPTTPKPAVGW